MSDPVTATWSHGPTRWSILVHGGAGNVPKERIAVHVAACERAAAAGAEVLASGGSALDAVQRAVEVLEDEPALNAGTGACLNEDGDIELDASLMDGASLRAGAVCALPPFTHPIAIARRVMDASPHVLLAGAGAARFAVANGFLPAEPASMITDLARQRLEAVRTKQATEGWAGGTVGAVARDADGHVAAATSTGGTVNKLAGRVGDAPLIGSGTYADDTKGACSTTGDGEAMIRVCLAKSAVDLATNGAGDAARRSLTTMHARTGGDGGLLVVGHDGALGWARTTKTMSWAAITDDGARTSGA